MSSSKSTVAEAVDVLGELFIMGFSGLEPAEHTSRFISDKKIGGVILFSHNYESPGQVTELIHEIQECRQDLPLWITVDHEGGRVQRFKKGFSRIPTAAQISSSGSPKLAFEISQIIASELKAVGVNLNFFPLADIATNPKNPVIGDRAFGETEEIVSKFCSAAVRGHLTQGVQPCVKHFPGHGDTSSDSHFTLPSVSTSLDLLEKREFLTFAKAFKSGCNFVMTAHIVAQQLDPKVPATLSQHILLDILRGTLHYEGIIISDDLEMKAITDHYGAKEAPRLALEAGCNMLIYRTQAAAEEGYESLVAALEAGTLSPEIVIASANRSRNLKREVLLPFQPASIADLRKKLATHESSGVIQRVLET